MRTTVGDQFAVNSKRRRCMVIKKNGERCQNTVDPNMTACRWHGANGKMRRKAMAYKVIDELAEFYDPEAAPIKDPIAELQRLGGVLARASEVAGKKVNELENWDTRDDKGAVHIKGVMQVLLQLMKMHESVTTTLAKLGIDERRVQVQEREQQLIVTALRAIMSDPELALTPVQRQAWESVVPRHLRALTESVPT